MSIPQPAIELLDAIRRHRRPISKAELVRQTAFSLATVTEHTDLLVRTRLALEGDKGQSTGGRKPKLLNFNADAGRIIAVDLESTKVRGRHHGPTRHDPIFIAVHAH